MTIQQIYDLAIKMGIDADPRGSSGVKRFLERRKKEHEEMPVKHKKYFDGESLINPYSDSRILFGNPKLDVKKVLAGIDAEAAEILLVDRLNEKGKKIDLLISHHPSGHALASLHEVMDLQVDHIASEVGVPENVLYGLFEEHKAGVQRRFAPLNHNQTGDAAKLLNVPLLALHTAWDNIGYKFIKHYLAEKKFDTVGEILDYLNELPEYSEATKGKAGPTITSGSSGSKVGKIFVGFTGGTEPSKEVYEEMAKAGVGTIIEMHIKDEAVDSLKKLYVNVISAGHIASDSIGANLFLDELEKKGVEVIPCSGLIRVKRVKS